MRATIILTLAFSIFAGCHAGPSRSQSEAVAATLGISEEEFATIKQDVGARSKLIVVKFGKSDDGSIHANLAQTADALTGPVIVFRKNSGRWIADSGKSEIWVVTKQ